MVYWRCTRRRCSCMEQMNNQPIHQKLKMYKLFQLMWNVLQLIGEHGIVNFEEKIFSFQRVFHKNKIKVQFLIEWEEKKWWDNSYNTLRVPLSSPLCRISWLSISNHHLIQSTLSSSLPSLSSLISHHSTTLIQWQELMEHRTRTLLFGLYSLELPHLHRPQQPSALHQHKSKKH